MISRKCTLLVSNIISKYFVHTITESYNQGKSHKLTNRVDEANLRDFLFEYNVSGFVIEKLCKSWETPKYLKDSILNIHTGIFYDPTNYHKFENKGQEDITNIILGILKTKSFQKEHEELENLLKIDGYIYEKGKLYTINNDIQEKAEIILIKYKELNLDKELEFVTFYKDINDHFESSKYSDSIHSGRKIYEIVLTECALKFSREVMKDGKIVGDENAVTIRKYLEDNQFFSADEINIVHYYYKYMSNVGSHPNLALKEQADFSRIMTLNTVLYTLNRMDSFIK